MGKGSRKYISLMELHNDNVEKQLMEKDAYWGYLEIYGCNEDDYLYYEDCATSYFMDKHIHLVHDFNDDHQLLKGDLPEPTLKYDNKIYYEIDFSDINLSTHHPIVIQFIEHFKILQVVKNFKIYFTFYQRAWSNAEVPTFEIILSSDKNNRLYHKPSVFNLNTIFETHPPVFKAPAYADTLFKIILYVDIQRRPRVYAGFHDIEDLINNFEDYSWMVDAITC